MFDNANGSSRLHFGKPLQVFRHRLFLIFWVGACISNIGNWTENAAQSWAVTSQTVGNPHQGLLVEVLQFADFCPVLLLALFAGVISDRVNRKVWFLTHYMSPSWVIRLMLGALLVVTVVFLFVREPAIDNLPRRNSGKITLWENFWEAVTAHSHHPAYPSEIAVSTEEGKREGR